MPRFKKKLLYQAIYIVIAFIFVLPIIYAFSISLMNKRELLTQASSIFPKNITNENYKEVAYLVPIGRYMLNSFIVAIVSSVSRVLVAIISAYAFSFHDFKYKNQVFMLFMLATLVPADIMLLPNYRLIARLGLVNKYLGITSIMMVSLTSMLLMRQNFLSFPKSIKDAAEIDGCSNLDFLTKILIPICKPIIVTIFLTSFISVWNAYLWPLIITTDVSMRTVQIGITLIQDRESINYGPVMAGTIISLLPTLLLFTVFRRKIIEGMTTGGVKE